MSKKTSGQPRPETTRSPFRSGTKGLPSIQVNVPMPPVNPPKGGGKSAKK